MAVLAAWTCVVALAAPPTWDVPRLEGPVRADGILSEPQYREAFTWEGFVETSPRDNAVPAWRTRLYLFSTREALVVAMECLDPAPEKIRRQRYGRDEIAGSEHVEVLLDPHGEAKQALLLAVTPENDVADALEDLGTGAVDLGFDLLFEHGARVTENGWTVEIVLPFSSFRFPTGPRGRFLLGVTRIVPREDDVTIGMLPERRGSEDPREGMAYLLVDLRDVGTSRTFHWIPAWVGSLRRTRSGGESDRSLGGHGSLTLSWVPRSDTEVKATFRPDFSDVEADGVYQQVNNRYPVYLPEKRPFFLDGSESFRTPFRLYWSRMIVAPDWGLRVSHRGRRVGLYGLVARENGVPGERFGDAGSGDVTWAVARGTLALGERGSYLGGMVTHRSFGGSGGTVLSADGLVKGRHLTLSWQGARSRVDGPEGAVTGTAVTASGLFSWNRYLWTSARYYRISPGFRAEAGYVPWVDEEEVGVSQGLDYEPQEKVGFLRRLNVQASVHRKETTGGELVDRGWSGSVFAEGPRLVDASCTFSRTREGYGGREFPRADLLACGFQWSEHPSFVPFASFERGEGVLYSSDPRLVDLRSRSVGFARRRGRARFQLSSSAWRFGQGAQQRRQVGWEGEFQFVWSERTELRVFATLNRLRMEDLGYYGRFVTVNVLGTWRLNPFSSVYVGLNLDNRDDRLPAWSYEEESRRRQLFVKVQWYF